MYTLGIDLASQPENTAVCLIQWKDNLARAVHLATGVTDAEIYALIDTADVVGIDAPFGWPKAFSEAVQNWDFRHWDAEVSLKMRFRYTDLKVRELTGKYPLSVSTDRIALPAMRCMSLLQRYNVHNKGNDGRFFEVYPAGAMSIWNLHVKQYKKDHLQQAVDLLQMVAPWLMLPKIPTEHAFDAVIAALVARTATCQLTVLPTPEETRLAQSEGWIHIPLRNSLNHILHGAQRETVGTPAWSAKQNTCEPQHYGSQVGAKFG